MLEDQWIRSCVGTGLGFREHFERRRVTGISQCHGKIPPQATDSGALTDAEFEQQKARILGG
jgi:hypothetical protein